MKRMSQIIFFSIVILVLGSLHTYLIIRGLQVIPPSYKTLFITVIFIFAFSYVAARIMENTSCNIITQTLVWIGSVWFAIMMYYFFAVLIVDILRLINHFIPFFPAFITDNPERTKTILGWSVSALILVTVLAGHLNSRNPVLKKINIPINKKAGDLKTLNIAMISDVHLGTIIGRPYLNKVVNKINSLNPDIILMPGDVIDEDIKPVVENNVGELLKNLKSKYGVYAVTGNHEYIGGVREAVNYLTDHGVKMLSDTVELIDGKFYLAGREDRSIKMFSGKTRKTLVEILSGVDKTYPVILMDHQPIALNEAEENGVDLQLSGHTHNGQLWPLNYITDAVYEIGWGYLKKGNTQYYVSCGVGGWGPPARLGSRPEIMNFILTFD